MGNELDGRSIIVTGAGRRLGAGIAADLARKGARVAVADPDRDSAEVVAAHIGKDGGETRAFSVDVASRDSVRTLTANTYRQARTAALPQGIRVNAVQPSSLTVSRNPAHSRGVTGRDAGRRQAGEERFAAYLDAIAAVLGHTSRVDPARAYCTGLLLPSERKSVGPMAARIEPGCALGQMRQALADSVPVGVVLGDAGYGNETDLRVGVSELGLLYVLRVQSSTTVWPPGTAPLPSPPYSGRGLPPTRVRRSADIEPVSVKDLAQSLPPRAWHTLTWRESSQTELSSRFAALRIRPAHRDTTRTEPWPEEWPLIEWPEGEAEPTKYWLSTLPPRTTLKHLVHTAKARWRIKRDYRELKQEIGLGHYDGRCWRGFHRHAASQPTASSSPSAVFFPSTLRAPADRGTCATPRLPAARRRPSGLSNTWRTIASVRRRLTVALVSTLPCCPCCLQVRRRRRNEEMTQ